MSNVTWHSKRVTHGKSHVVHLNVWLKISHMIDDTKKGNKGIKKKKKKIIIRIKKKDKNEKKSQKRNGERKRAYKREIFLFFNFFVSFSDLWKSDHRFSSEQKTKLIYATRATRGLQNLGVLSNFTK